MVTIVFLGSSQFSKAIRVVNILVRDAGYIMVEAFFLYRMRPVSKLTTNAASEFILSAQSLSQEMMVNDRNSKMTTSALDTILFMYSPKSCVISSCPPRTSINPYIDCPAKCRRYARLFPNRLLPMRMYIECLFWQ